ncbi:MAG: hypothetical protein LBC07_06585, partial [Elusimicrobiota bacterium]|nr:hypothetical protein [Elusimicrobiota bacterium]
MKIFICAGDLSGDQHSAALISAIKQLRQDAFVFAVGGDKLKAVSDVFLDDIVNLNAFGFLPIKQIFALRKTFIKIKECFIKEKPDKIILTDYYGFNIKVAKLAKSLSIPVYYFISPQIWASRKARIKILKKYIKKMLVIFPFEQKIYTDAGVDAYFIGNPLLDKVTQKENFDLPACPVIGLFCGSRKDTIKRHLPVILKTVEIIKQNINARFIMFSKDESIKDRLPSFIEFDAADDFNLRKIVNIAISPSGTVSLENALMAIPAAIMYKLSYINYFIIRSLIEVNYITISNIIFDRPFYPEFIQYNAKPQKIADYILWQLEPQN